MPGTMQSSVKTNHCAGQSELYCLGTEKGSGFSFELKVIKRGECIKAKVEAHRSLCVVCNAKHLNTLFEASCAASSQIATEVSSPLDNFPAFTNSVQFVTCLQHAITVQLSFAGASSLFETLKQISTTNPTCPLFTSLQLEVVSTPVSKLLQSGRLAFQDHSAFLGKEPHTLH